VHDTQQMQRVEMTRVRGQYLAAQSLGLLKLTRS
jgi:hypothetical protein